MKAILEFTLPDEQDEHTLALKGGRYYCALYDFSQVLRNHVKYVTHTDEEYALVEKLRDEFYQVMEDNNVSFDEVS